MANREELGLIRGARAGAAQAQLALGRRYLFGGSGLPHSLPTALHWLERAARQGCAEASLLIGQHIPLALARQSRFALAPCYARAFDAGELQAGLVLAQLVLAGGVGALGEPGIVAADAAAGVAAALRAKARVALRAAAAAGIEGARHLLAQLGAAALPAPRARAPVRQLRAPLSVPDGASDAARTIDRQGAMLDAAWQAGRWTDYLQRALPSARALVQAAGAGGAHAAPTPAEALLLSRCARALMASPEAPAAPAGALTSTPAATRSAALADSALARHMRELAAHANERDAQMAMGLWFARMRVDGKRTADGPGAANFKKAIRWLTLAGEQGVAAAWYALARIYMKPEFSQRNVGEAQRYLELAASMGYRDAQRECGRGAWRARREQAGNDVRAVYWLQKAAAQGCALSAAALRKIAPRGGIVPYLGGSDAAARAFAAHYPLLAARLELAAAFGLNRAEALLIDLPSADHGHCLVVDIRDSHGRSKRRLLLVESAQERQLLDRLGRLFEQHDSGPGGPEGNYRQRLYRLRMLQTGQSAMPSYGLAA
jgi:TPR repeat protein